MSKLKANINIKDFEEFKVLHDIFHKMLNDENINVGIRLKYIHEFNNKIEKDNNMKVPYVKVNNQQEFERVVAKMEKETGLKLDGYLTDIYTVVGLDDIHSKITTWNEKFISDKIISADEYLTGTIENFTLDDLEDGMVVEIVDGELFLVLSGFLVNNRIKYGSSIMDTFNKHFEHKYYKYYESLSISKIYNRIDKNLNFEDMLSTKNLTLIFDAEAHRNKCKTLQRKSEIESEIKKLQEELNNL